MTYQRQWMCAAAIYLLQSSQEDADPEDLGACVALILDALDDIICTLEAAPARSLSMTRSGSDLDSPSAMEEAMHSSPGSECPSSHNDSLEPGPINIPQEALLWGLKALQASATRSQLADRQVQAFLLLHGCLMSSLSLAISTAMQGLISAVQDGQRIGLALLANAQAAMTDDKHSIDMADSLGSFLQHICSCASIFEHESCHIAREIQKRECQAASSKKHDQPGVSSAAQPDLCVLSIVSHLVHAQIRRELAVLLAGHGAIICG